jgi:guanylate kinase
MSNKSVPIVFIISAPSGAGKTTLIHRIMATHPNLAFSISHTTRPPRQGEINKQDYYFISRETFREMIKNNAFLEWATVFGEYYGTSTAEIQRLHKLGKNVILDIDVQGALQVMEKLDKNQFISIFILPPDMETLKQRLISRGKDPTDQIEKRLAEARKEIQQSDRYNFRIINDNLERATRNLSKILRPPHSLP